MPGLAPNRRTHSPWLSSTLCGRPKSSSPEEKAVPRTGCAPMTSKKLAVTLLPRICSEALMGTSCDNPLGDHVVDRVIHERTADLEFVLSAAIWLKFHGIIAVFAFEFLGLGIAPA